MTKAIQQAKSDLRFLQAAKLAGGRFLAVRCGRAMVAYPVALLVVLAGRRLAEITEQMVYGKGDRPCA